MPSKTVQIVLAIVSLAMFVGTLLAIPIVAVRLPEDYFVRPPPRHSLGTKIVRNVLGAVVVAFGVLMLVLPGQGVLTILLGLSILDLPLKHRLVRKLLQRPTIARAVQSLRAKAHKPPLHLPADDGRPTGDDASIERAGSSDDGAHLPFATAPDATRDASDDDLSSPERGARSASVRPGSSRPSRRSS